jgi:hypothetical protein
MALRTCALLSLVLAACAPMRLPEAPDDPSIYAGWKAGAACSAVFLGHRALADVLGAELGGLPAFASDDAYSALGSRGQCVTIVPSHDLVVVRTGLDAEPEGVLWRQDRFLLDLSDTVSD